MKWLPDCRSAASVLAVMMLAGAARAQEITVYCQDITFGCKTIAPVAARFQSENPGVKVNLEAVTYQSLVESMPVQLESGDDHGSRRSQPLLSRPDASRGCRGLRKAIRPDPPMAARDRSGRQGDQRLADVAHRQRRLCQSHPVRAGRR